MLTIIHKAGSTLDLPIQVFKDGAALSLAGCTVVYLVKTDIADADAAAVLTFAAGNGLAITDQANGWIKLTKTAVQMAITPGKYQGFLQVVTATGAVIEIPDTELKDVWVILQHGVKATS